MQVPDARKAIEQKQTTLKKVRLLLVYVRKFGHWCFFVVTLTEQLKLIFYLLNKISQPLLWKSFSCLHDLAKLDIF